MLDCKDYRDNMISNEEYKLDREEVLRYLGYNGQKIEEDLQVLINMCREEVLNKSKPRYIYEYFDLDKSIEGIKILKSDTNFTGKDIERHLYNCNKCVIMAVTLGQELERYIKLISKVNMTKAVILDACATTLTEEVCDKIESKIKMEVQNELTTRFSPGYGDLSIEFQRDIVNLLKTEKKIGLTLSTHNLLIPRKSVTAIIGIGNEIEKKHYNKCLYCNKNKTCAFRRRGKICAN